MLRTVWLAISIVVVTSPAFAQQRPLVTEDPETVGSDRVLVEGGVEFDKDQLYSAYGLTGDTAHIATFGVSAGISPTAELQVDGGLVQRLHVTERRTAPLSSTLTFTGDEASSFEDLSVATKLRLVSETAQRPAFGVRFGARLPTADPHKGMGLGTTDFFATLLVAKTVQSIRTVGNVGWVVLGNPVEGQDTGRTLGLGLSVARAITNEFEAVGELNGHLGAFGSTVPAGLGSRGVLRFAGRYTHEFLRFDFGVLVGITPRDPSFGISAGATYVFTR